DQAGERYERGGRREKDPRRLVRRERQHPGDRREDEQRVDWGRKDGSQHVQQRRALVAELLHVLVVGARKQAEEGIEAAIERSPELRNRAVKGVERQAGGGAVGQLQGGFLDALERA